MMDRTKVPKLYQAQYDQAMSGRSRRGAIRVYCLMCVGWQQKEVHLCTSPGCPLYPYRLGTSKHLPGDDEPMLLDPDDRAETEQGDAQ